MINWKVRIKNRMFWITFVPAVLMLAQAVASLFGVTIDLGWLNDRLKAVIDAVFLVLATTGVVIDMTTPGVSDSIRALSYETPGSPMTESEEDLDK